MTQLKLSTLPTQTDIIVAGGGPAGATVARLLAGYGLRVVVLERHAFPRYQIGESLTPRILPIFDFLNIRSEVERAGFLPIAGHTVCWGEAQPRTTYYSPDHSRRGFQVWRADFDALLLDQARQAGAQVFEGQAVEAVSLPQGSDGVHVRTASRQRITASFFIDATGRSGLLARQGLRRRNRHFQTLALAAYWRDVVEPRGVERGNTLIEAYANGMVWSLALHTGLRNVTLLVDWWTGSDIRRTTLADCYHAELGKAPYISSLLQGAQTAIAPHATDATLYTATQFGDVRFLLVGDAGLFIDPLSSEGVHKAMASALTGAVVVNTLLRRPTMRSHALSFYEQRQLQTYTSHYRQSLDYYRQEQRWPESPFWRARTGGSSSQDFPPAPPVSSPLPSASHKLSHLQWAPGVSIQQRPTIEGAYISLQDTVIAPRYPDGVRFLDRICLPTVLRIVAQQPAIGEIIPAYLNHPDGQSCAPEAVRQGLARCFQEGIVVEAGPEAVQRASGATSVFTKR